ncbi:MAG: protein kinase [Chitinivibrionales bacterium]|nr:protein kinase [Chitinivibrionales bacterium]
MIPKLPKGFTHPMRIGEGGFSSVYRARQTALDRWVAIKIIHENDPEKKQVLLKEGKTQAQIQIGSVPRVYDAFEWKNKIYIVMEWIKGVSLNEILKQHLQDNDRLCIAGSFIGALAELHSLGYAHRDLKPQNILISPEKGLSFIDFGFTKHIVDSKASMIGTVKGTPAYMAPELWRGEEKIDYIRADIYSAGLILKEILRDHPAHSITKYLLNEKASDRIESGKKLYDLWTDFTRNMHFQQGWQENAGALYSKIVSDELCDAARELIAVRRDDEAYWLLVESLEEDPNNAEALSLMDSLANSPAHKSLKRTYSCAAAAVLVVCIALTAFLAGRRSGEIPAPDGTMQSPERGLSGMMKEVVEKSPVSTVDLPLRHDSIAEGKLSGRIYFANLPLKGAVKVDKKQIDYEGVQSGGIVVSYGKHTVAWDDETGCTKWREKVSLLPFQTKIINLPQRFSSQEQGLQ